MRITDLTIVNFKAIRQLELRNLSEVVLIAGPNGCGKSCVFDAIRFMSSFYSNLRQQNYWHSYFNELQISPVNTEEWLRIFNDTTRGVEIKATFSLMEEEKTYIAGHAYQLLYKSLWRQHVGNEVPLYMSSSDAPTNLHNVTEQIQQLAKNNIDVILASLQSNNFQAGIAITTDLEPKMLPNPAMQFVLSLNDAHNIGMIDYHGPNRNYQRERLGGNINVNIQEAADKAAQQSVFNWQNKYSNIKTELASAFVRDMIIEKAGGQTKTTTSIISTLTELFTLFLPGKEFVGPRPGRQGELSFPVKISTGSEHDIDDLSSGEKELVYGYLRIRNLSPRRSIILLDEPELHLNPRLVLGLPGFYRKHIGTELDNQLWMVTHSDAFLRDAFRSGGMSIFHMTTPQNAEDGRNQATPIDATDIVDRAIIDLVGDIAGFRHGNKIVIFESSESASFDAMVTTRLFPELTEKINALSGDNKFSVRQLYQAMEKAVAQMKLPYKVYAIVDRDADLIDNAKGATRVFQWDVYHIESYLMEPQFIRKVLCDNPSHASDMIEDDILGCLKGYAEATLPALVAHQLRVFIDAELKRCLDLGYDPKIADPAEGLTEAVERVKGRVAARAESTLGGDAIAAKRTEVETELRKALEDGSWKAKFRGRDILKRFAGDYLRGLPYEAFRDAIVARMADANFKPPGMAEVVTGILQD